ncbi:MAG: hypothetical protein K2K92_09325 [Duncaniella sp.]|nr:hypothetical protein [Duncaniella sp.]
MKKIFTLLAVAAMAVAANAQDNIYKSTGENVVAETVLVDNDALSVTTVYNADGKTISALTDGASEFKTIDGIEFPGYFQLRVNADPKGEDLTGTEQSGSTPLVVVVKKKLTLAVYNRRQKGTNPSEGYNPGDNKGLLCVNQAGLVKVTGTTSEPTFDDPDNDAFGYCVESFVLEPGTYTLYRKGSTMQIYGFSWTVEGGETPEPAEGETVEIIGAGSGIFNKVFDSIVIPFDFNIDTKELTLKNFLGGTTTVELKYTKNSSASGDNVPGTLYNAEAVSGLGEKEQMQGYYEVCPINGFTGDFVCKVDGVDFCKLENIKVGVGFASTVQINEDPTTHKKYCEVLVMLGGDYSKWDADKAEWVASGLNYVKIRKNVYFPEDPSSLEVIEAADENAPVEYYNLQGVRINEPAAGQIVIRRQGAKVTKMVVR